MFSAFVSYFFFSLALSAVSWSLSKVIICTCYSNALERIATKRVERKVFAEREAEKLGENRLEGARDTFELSK